jgi:hypothetical protein
MAPFSVCESWIRWTRDWLTQIDGDVTNVDVFCHNYFPGNIGASQYRCFEGFRKICKKIDKKCQDRSWAKQVHLLPSIVKCRKLLIETLRKWKRWKWKRHKCSFGILWHSGAPSGFCPWWKPASFGAKLDTPWPVRWTPFKAKGHGHEVFRSPGEA